MLEGSGTPSPSASGGEQAGAQRFQSSGSGAATVGGTVYMGSSMTEGAGPGGAASKIQQPNYLTKQLAYQYFNNFSGKQLRDFIAAGQVSGQLQDDAGFLEGQKLWKKLVDASAGLTAAGHNVSPLDVLASYTGKGPLGAAGSGKSASVWQTQYRSGRKFLVNTQTGEVKYEGPRFETTYQKTIDLTDPTTAKAIATSVFQSLLHRDPGNGELGGFSDALRSAEQNSPVVTNTTTEYDPNTGEVVGQTASTSGGLSSDAKSYLATQRIKKSKEYGAVQAATTYENALENAVFNNPFGSVG